MEAPTGSAGCRLLQVAAGPASASRRQRLQNCRQRGWRFPSGPMTASTVILPPRSNEPLLWRLPWGAPAVGFSRSQPGRHRQAADRGRRIAGRESLPLVSQGIGHRNHERVNRPRPLPRSRRRAVEIGRISGIVPGPQCAHARDHQPPIIIIFWSYYPTVGVSPWRSRAGIGKPPTEAAELPAEGLEVSVWTFNRLHGYLASTAK